MFHKPKLIKYLIVLILSAIVLNVMWELNKIVKISKNNRVSLPHITEEYSDLFSERMLNQLAPSFTYFNKYKEPVASYNLKNDDYQIMIYNLDYINNSDKLEKFIHLNWESDRETTPDLMYDGSYSTSDVQFFNAEHFPEQSRHLYISLDARPVQDPIITDSLLSYSAICTSIAGKTAPNSAVEFYLERQTIFKNGELSFAFIRKQNRLFMFVLTPRNLKGKFDTNLLYTILSSN
jgi:hypothetical protein